MVSALTEILKKMKMYRLATINNFDWFLYVPAQTAFLFFVRSSLNNYPYTLNKLLKNRCPTLTFLKSSNIVVIKKGFKNLIIAFE